ncbi:hypothetical protein JYU34_004888 [Plutella xylostella]|uniref:COMM domain-containing protein 4 n=1 Tax=Plutella xylostella TaxID=51655 RepID=A0ABQ7QVH0_PLUXY|nr:hypothetical protein JYU34_004888 [Plutella xylostella]
MKFKFCSDGDCPLWALAALHAASALPAPLFHALLAAAMEGQNEDAIMEILKDTSLSSRDESARAAAVLRWTVQQAWSSSCRGAQATRDLLVLGVPRAHATALGEAVDSGRAVYERKCAEDGFMVNRVTDVSATPGPEGSADTIKLTLFTDDVFTGEQGKNELLIDRSQAKVLLAELKTAHKKMEELDE